MYSGIDYLTISEKSENREYLIAMEESALRVAEWLYPGQSPKQSRLRGINGISYNGAFIGRGDDTFLLNVPSSAAQDFYLGVYRSGMNVTRIDIQVTSKQGYNRKYPNEPFLGYYGILNEYKSPNKGRTPLPLLHLSETEGTTVDSGSRESRSFGRIYDKGRQSKDDRYDGFIRWELQCRRENAIYIAEKLVMLNEEEIIAIIPEYVTAFFSDRGLRPVWAYTHRLLWQKQPRSDYDYERTLKWLSTQVAPSIDTLLAYVSEDKILEALGLYETKRVVKVTGTKHRAVTIRKRKQGKPKFTSIDNLGKEV